MVGRRSRAVLLGSLALAGFAEAGDHRARVAAPCLPGLPPAPYRYHRYSPPVLAVSEPAQSLGMAAGAAPVDAVMGLAQPGSLLVAPVPGPYARVGKLALGTTTLAEPSGPRRAKLFQFVRVPVLRIDHCFLSRMAVTLTEDGDYVVSFRADQNPIVNDDDRFLGPVVPDDIKEEVRQTSQILRNVFFVRVRGYGPRPAPASGLPAGVAGPVLFEVVLPPFWVERGVPRSVRVADRLPPEMGRYFDVVDSVEIEFYYEYQVGLKTDIP